MHLRPRSSSSQFLHKSTISLFTLLHHQHRNFTTIHPVDTRNSNTFLLPISTPSQEQEHDPLRHLAQRKATDTHSTQDIARRKDTDARSCSTTELCRWSHDYGPRWEESLTNATTNTRRRTVRSTVAQPGIGRGKTRR